jgi:RNase P subunit RPR2
MATDMSDDIASENFEVVSEIARILSLETNTSSEVVQKILYKVAFSLIAKDQKVQLLETMRKNLIVKCHCGYEMSKAVDIGIEDPVGEVSYHCSACGNNIKHTWRHIIREELN